jgi:hypothetical protein
MSICCQATNAVENGDKVQLSYPVSANGGGCYPRWLARSCEACDHRCARPKSLQNSDTQIGGNGVEFPIAYEASGRSRHGRRGIRKNPSGTTTRTNPRSGVAVHPNEPETSRILGFSGCAAASDPGRSRALHDRTPATRRCGAARADLSARARIPTVAWTGHEADRVWLTHRYRGGGIGSDQLATSA